MEDNRFNIHLISNVLPETFPNNGPAQFSTLLAEEIPLNNDGWEVAVKDIMYPSNVASTTEADELIFYKTNASKFRKHIPIQVRQDNHTLIPFARPIPITQADWTKFHKSKDGGPIATIMNNTPENKGNRLYKFTYSAQHRRFHIQVYADDCTIVMSDVFALHTGFGNAPCFVKGMKWAPHIMTGTSPSVKKPDVTTLYFIDMTYVTKKNYALKTKIDKDLNTTFVGDIETHWKKDFHLTFTLIPREGKVRFSVHGNAPNNYVPLAFIAFDDATTKALSLPPIIGVQMRLPHFFLPVPSFNGILPTYVQEAVDAKVLTTLATKTVRLTTWSFVVPEIDVVPSATPAGRLTLTKKVLTTPDAFVAPLNEKASTYKYKFTYDSDRSRFQVQVDPDYVIQMSPSLASILGFDTNALTLYGYDSSGATPVWGEHITKAHTFPLLNRAITDLYVYTNIVDSSYIGNVKAPLLLSCPFHKQGQFNHMTYLEFINPSFVPLNRSRLQQIDIEIRDAAGTLVPFLFGRTVLNLIFRRRYAT